MDKMISGSKLSSQGRLEVICPFYMQTGKKYRVLCSILTDRRIVIQEIKKSEVHEIPVTDLMSCSLTGDAFTITNINNGIQRVIKPEKTLWQWKVVPKKWGTQELFLLVSIHIRNNNETSIKDIPVFERSIFVRINPIYHTKEFFLKHWQWLIGTIIGSGLLWQILSTKK